MYIIVVKSIQDLFNIKIDPIDFNQLKYIEDPIVNSSSTMKASGFRMGLAYVTPGVSFDPEKDKPENLYYTTGELLEAGKKYPLLLQIGYQFEGSYLSAGNFQALIEGLIFINGIEKEMFSPSFALLNGFRS